MVVALSRIAVQFFIVELLCRGGIPEVFLLNLFMAALSSGDGISTVHGRPCVPCCFFIVILLVAEPFNSTGIPGAVVYPQFVLNLFTISLLQ